MTTQPDNDNKVLTPEQLTEELKNIQQVVFAYSFYDSKSHLFDTPFFARDNTQAKRHYGMVTEKDTVMARFREDFDLYLIGSFNHLTSEYTPYKTLLIKGERKNEISNES